MDSMTFAIQNYCKVRCRKLEKQSIGLAEIIKQAWEDITLNVTATEAQLEYGDMPVVEADPVMLRMLMLHLLGNAVERTTEQTPVVRILSRVEDGFTRIEIEDKGRTLSKDSRANIFELTNHTDPAKSGQGFTFHLCKQIVESHGGQIGVDDTNSGQGNLFWFTLQNAPASA